MMIHLNDEQDPGIELEQALQRALALTGPHVLQSARPGPHRLDVIVAPDDLPQAVAALINARWGYLAAITGLDLGLEEGLIEAIYHFCAGPDILWVRVRMPRDEAQLPTICDVIPSASFYERELSEMLGVTVRGTPDPRSLFLPEEWPQGVYPLRKDYEPEAGNA